MMFSSNPSPTIEQRRCERVWRHSVRRRRTSLKMRRPGIILLVVLGMLALFSLLAATYIVFTARASQSSTAIARRETRDINAKAMHDEAIMQILRGSDTMASSLYGHSLGEDYYGHDLTIGKVLNLSATAGNGGPAYLPNPLEFGAEVMLGRSSQGADPVRAAAWLKIPVQLMDIDPNNPNADGFEDLVPNPLVAFPPPYNVSDELTGRNLTFVSGPLAGLTMTIRRSIPAVALTDPYTQGNRNCLFVDLSPHLEKPITVDVPNVGLQTRLLREWLPTKLAARPATFGDNSNLLLYQNPATQGIGYTFRVSPRPRNGKGLGWKADPERFNLDTKMPVVASGNQVGVPPYFQGHFKYASPFPNGAPDPNWLLIGDSDEPLDVPDYHDYLLGYYPPKANSPFLGITAPSGVRPAMLNHLLNYFGNVTVQANGTVNVPWTQAQARIMLQILQRASLRPIPVENAAANLIDLSGGEFAEFTGSNTGYLKNPIKIDSSGNITNPGQIALAFHQLIHGPWDVDTDGDGETDAVWIDAGFGIVTMSDGTPVRPMIAVRIEDLDSRIDLNVVDSAASVLTQNVNGTAAISSGFRPHQFNGTFAGFQHTSQQLLHGFGVGPAEISMQGLFSFPGVSLPALDKSSALISERYGLDRAPGISVSLPANAGGRYPTNTGNDPLAVWSLFGRTNLHKIAFAQITSGGASQKVNYPESRFGYPLDMHGVGLIALDPFGQPISSPLWANPVLLPYAAGTADDALNSPYEVRYRSKQGLDTAFTLAELEPVLRYRDWDRSELPGRVRTAIDSAIEADESEAGGVRRPNPSLVSRDTLPRAITTVSSTDDAPSVSLPARTRTEFSAADYSPASRLALNTLISSLTDPKFEVMLPPELRRGKKLNLNRPFGNGEAFFNPNLSVVNQLPPASDLTVDDPLELLNRTDALFNSPLGNPHWTLGDFTSQLGRLPYGSVPALNPNQLSYSSLWPQQAIIDKFHNEFSRQEFARHLYAMTMLLIAQKELENGVMTVKAYDFRAYPTNVITENVTEDAARARAVAQWAVNVVDFRDRDAIMTRFEYDPSPFDGWDENPLIAGDVDTFVWGTENPELLLTENFSIHDRRVKDTDRDHRNEGPRLNSSDEFEDRTMDQIRVPQGSTFIEVYATRGAKPFGQESDMHISAPPELYSLVPRSLLTSNNNNLNDPDAVPILDLGRLAPDGNPVWRVGITDIQDPADPSPLALLDTIENGNNSSEKGRVWDTVTFSPDRQDLRWDMPQNPNFRFDRVIWFASQDPKNVGNALPTDSRVNTPFGAPLQWFDDKRVFYNRLAANDYRSKVIAGLEGGQYAVVGPRPRTYVGAQQYSDATGPSSFNDFFTRQYFDLRPQPSGFEAFVPDERSPDAVVEKALTPVRPPVTARQIVPIIAAAPTPSSPNAPNGPYWTDIANTAPTGIGINISEPLPLEEAVVTGGRTYPKYYYEPTHFLNSDEPTDVLGIAGFAKDAYFDYSDLSAPPTVQATPFDSESNMPLRGLENTGTRFNFRTAYLQRLADPTIGYDPVINPYITVDWMAMDLTVFNGDDNNDQELRDKDGNKQWIDPADESPFGKAPEEAFASRSKNGRKQLLDGKQSVETDHVIWSYGTEPPATSTYRSNIRNYRPNFPIVLVHRQDWNDLYPGPYLPGRDRTLNSFTMGYLNYAFGPRNDVGIVNPQTEMFAGVPYDRNTRPALDPFPWLGFLNRDFASPMELMLVPASSPDRLMMEFGMPQGGGLNPYEAKSSPSDPHFEVDADFNHLFNFFSQSDDAKLSPNLWRLFDFVDTGDPFVESKEMLPPQKLANPETARELEALAPYFPPLNFVADEMRAGRVNVNTVNNPLVWRALMWLHSHNAERTADVEGSLAFWNEWMQHRRGYGNAGSNLPDPAIPTQFLNPLQAGDYSSIAPPADTPTINGQSAIDALRRKPTDGTLLRNVGAGGAVKTAFQRPTEVQIDRNVNRSAFHRYQTMMRMPNLVSDNSNTYAVWVTLGFFEVDPADLSVRQEYGIEQGTNQRPRAFYIIDRSVPVDFVPGQDTNVRNMVLLERILE